ncbi:unnamed protein product [Phaeothamnion confervicola]
MLELLDYYDKSAAAREKICATFDARLQELGHAERQPEARARVGELEHALLTGAKHFHFDEAGWAHLEGLDAGRFACRSLHQSRKNLKHGGSHRVRLWVLDGESAITDIGALQAAAPPRSLFQAASQFNCLESPGPYLADVAHYFHDPTQGPRASISAYPGTLLRHYAATGPDSTRFRQGDGRQINLLHRVALEGVATVRSGYLQSSNIHDFSGFACLLEDHFDEIEVGVHEGVEVVLGANWDGPVQGRRHISQVFTSTLAAGGYGRLDFADPLNLRIARQLQRAAYLGTLTAAAALGQARAVLTLIGGGVFGNPLELIWESILWACDEVAGWLSRDLTVIVNGRNLSSLDTALVRKAAQTRGGEVIYCGRSGARIDV